MLEYKIVKEWPENKLEEKVSKFIKEGWLPLGGVAAAANDGGSIHGYVQAIIRENKNER